MENDGFYNASSESTAEYKRGKGVEKCVLKCTLWQSCEIGGIHVIWREQRWRQPAESLRGRNGDVISISRSRLRLGPCQFLVVKTGNRRFARAVEHRRVVYISASDFIVSVGHSSCRTQDKPRVNLQSHTPVSPSGRENFKISALT
jgi:hypothetical protein